LPAKIFNAEFIVDGAAMPQSLFAMIRATHDAIRAGVCPPIGQRRVIEGGSRRGSSRIP